MSRWTIASPLASAAFLAGAIVMGAAPASAQGTLRIGMTASDIPLTTGQTDNGGEGQRFLGFTAYDALVNWDLSSATKPSDLVPGLATSWTVDATDKTKWIFKLRDGREIPRRQRVHGRRRRVEPRQAAGEGQRRNSIRASRRRAARAFRPLPATRSIDPLTVEITTKTPDATLPYQLAWIMMSSPGELGEAGQELGRGREVAVRAPARGRSSTSCRASVSSWCRIPTTGTRRAFPSSTRWC